MTVNDYKTTYPCHNRNVYPPMINTLVFEDDLVQQLAPITTGRLAYAVTCASYRLIDFLLPIAGPTVGLVRPYMQATQENDFGEVESQLNNELPWTLIVNARLVPSVASLQQLEALVAITGSTAATETVWLTADDTLAAAIVPTESLSEDNQHWLAVANSIAGKEGVARLSNEKNAAKEAELFCYPHDVILKNLSVFKDNLAHRIRVGHYQEQSFGVYLGKDVTVASHVVFDSSRGPIVIDDNAKIGPFSFLRGPIYLGPNVETSEHSSIKDEVSISRYCKIGGEVEGVVIEPYTNKKHYGFLGHSYLGSWINLGAGTSNSDLKNTYGLINMTYGERKVSTGSQFVGCVIGDYSKTAINTSIFTGKTIGVGSMVYGVATTNVPSFVNYARSFGQLGELPPAVVSTTQQRMFVRRAREQRPCDIQLIEDMFRLTASERPADLSADPIDL